MFCCLASNAYFVSDDGCGAAPSGGPQLKVGQLAGDCKAFELNAMFVEDSRPLQSCAMHCCVILFQKPRSSKREYKVCDLSAVPIWNTDPFTGIIPADISLSGHWFSAEPSAYQPKLCPSCSNLT